MDMSSSTMAKMSKGRHHNMESMPRKNMKGTSDHSAHSLPSTQHDMNMSDMDHTSMNMSADKEGEQSESSSMSSAQQPMQMNSKAHHMDSVSHGSMGNSFTDHADHSTKSDIVTIRDSMKTDHGMAKNHAMEMPTEPSIIGDK